MPWPVQYRTLRLDVDGTSYIRTPDFHKTMNEHDKRGMAWRFNGSWTTYQPKKTRTYKNLDRLGVESEDQFWNVMQEFKTAGHQPPPSLGSVFREYMKKANIKTRRPSITSPFYRAIFGGWQKALHRGSYNDTCYVYDINRAYRWSASAGLPDLFTAHYTKDLSWPIALYVVTECRPQLPFTDRRSVAVLTSEQRDTFGIVDAKVLHGIGFRDTIDLSPLFQQIDLELPLSSKRIGQTFWGSWNTYHGVEQIGFANMKSRELRNIFYNPVWCAFITARVKQRLWHWRNISLHFYSDSIITKEPIPTGTEHGDWKHVATYPSIFIKSPGVFRVGPKWVKHAGFKHDEVIPF